ncbi:N-acetyl-1-D-myo-inositol-2-amino-2-deoxy-alpha-D-glucopyranoside deacetylase [Nakamurella antarctica]|uniref:1D-myo-inositol 2-acetamido-2-deoxy-alpha-D-glucopyranoside deacetylase n=1 Tax=Nakamurella antarctica TaxID=1902245 RepID=A0A3G8ZJK7_9ACTN|nr:N-acetyl-1-D-myo-inositol-2-amino-2-deoxy-alpha-D-glucopyranoside deacetylase [Nakamurella antarctica]AZI57453.1 N-acetyl-1-D-myo-inositol-2-amino-2-deoxy-alpha-D-glucopyranoside deacetylase [Nakamurella antarctica]
MTWRLLAVHAHPDDESITMGGSLAHYARAGVEVTILTCTLGEEGEVIPPALAGLVAAEADQLGGYRHGELAAACVALGVRDHRYLGGIGAFRDSGMVGTPSAHHPRAFTHAAAGGVDHSRAVAALARVIEEIAPHVVLTYDSDGGYGHPDHVAAHQVTVAAALSAGVPRVLAVVRPDEAARAALAAFVVPDGYLPGVPADLGYLAPAEQIVVEIDLGHVERERRAALAAHATQVELLTDGFALSNRIAQPLMSREYFKLLAGVPVPRVDSHTQVAADDIFAGLSDD